MERDHVDVLVASTRTNFAYLSGFERTMLFDFGGRAFVILPRDEQRPTLLVVPPFELATVAERGTWVDEVRIGGSWPLSISAEDRADGVETRLAALLEAASATREGTIVAALESALRAVVGSGPSVIGTDDLGLTAELDPARAGKLRWRDARSLLREIRAIKTSGEIDRLREGARRNESAMLDAFGAASAGTTWHEVIQTFKSASIDRESMPRHWVGGAGSRSSAHFPGDDYPLAAGDLLRLDCGGAYGNYCSDTGHTASLGEPPADVRRAYDALRNGIETGAEAARPGVSGATLFELVGATIRKGIPGSDPVNVGHAIGLEQYDSFTFGPGSDVVLEPDFVFNLEAPYYELGRYGIQLEHTYCVTASGVEKLTARENGLIVL